MCCAKMLPSIPKSKKAVMCLTEKIHVLSELCSGMSYRVIGYEISVNNNKVMLTKTESNIIQKHT
jgi:hypothetical protein